MKLSVLVVAHNEEKRLHDCLRRLLFADELVVVLDKCSDGSEAIARQYTERILQGSWDIEGDRRNQGIDFCKGEWILEVDADEHVTQELTQEVLEIVASSRSDYHAIPVDNFIGKRLVRYGWGGSFGRSAYIGLFRKGCKIWGRDRVHPALTLKGNQGSRLKAPLLHYVDNNLSDVLRRLNSYADARAQDLCDKAARGEKISGMAQNIRRFFSRFIKCYFIRGGWREGGYGLVIASCAGLYPILSYLKYLEKRK